VCDDRGAAVTETEWLAVSEPGPLLKYLPGPANDRKLRLFACACCRQAWNLLTDPRSRAAVEFSERHADGGPKGKRGFPAVRRAAEAAKREARERPFPSRNSEEGALAWARMFAATAVCGLTAPVQIGCVIENLAAAYQDQPAGPNAGAPRLPGRSEEATQAVLLRDVFGNPFRPAAFDPRWRTADAVGLARGI
jgi:hypothetical protein